MSHATLGYRHSKDIHSGKDKSESCGQLVYLSDLGNYAPLNRMQCYQLVSLENRPPRKGEKHGGQTQWQEAIQISREAKEAGISTSETVPGGAGGWTADAEQQGPSPLWKSQAGPACGQQCCVTLLNSKTAPQPQPHPSRSSATDAPLGNPAGPSAWRCFTHPAARWLPSSEPAPDLIVGGGK